MTLVITTRPKPKTAWHGKSHHGTGAMKFVAVDGEGITLDSGEHRYVLLRVGTDRTIENPDGLHFTEIFEYLYDHYQPRTAFTGFYLGYDFTQWFRTLPETKARALLTREGIAKRRRYIRNGSVDPLPVECRGWQFDIMSKRRFRLRPKPCYCTISLCKCKKEPWMYICDAGGFFQTSFLVAINPAKWPKPILSDEEFALIQQGKEKRSSAVLDDDMRFYNLLENDVMARLMERTDEGIRALGVNLSPKQWFSPAQAAQVWMRGRAPTRETLGDAVPVWFRTAARAGFIAGWFEVFIHGPISGTVYQYDLNSAYPSVARNLPCLLHGTYDQGAGKPKNPTDYTLVKADVTVPVNEDRRYIGAMMHRFPTGRIARPIFTGGWYWLHELKAAERAGVCRVRRYIQWMSYDPCDCPPPLRELETLYLERLRQGKNTPLGRGARLVYNCVYGKLAQSIGMPEFMNFIYASLITTGCRVEILNAIATHPGGKACVAQVATDAVYFLSPHPGLPISNKLGEWDVTEHQNITLFKPGVYWDDEARKMIAAGDTPQFKARGVSARDMAGRLADIDRQFEALTEPPPLSVTVFGKPTKKDTEHWPSTEFTPGFQMITALQALMMNDWSLAGTLMDRPVKQSSWPGEKRQGAYLDGKMLRTEPIRHMGVDSWETDGDDIRSMPYEGHLVLTDEDDVTESYGITPDGMVDQLQIDAMMPDRKWTPDVQK